MSTIRFDIEDASSIDPSNLADFLRGGENPNSFRRSETPEYYAWLLRGPEPGATVARIALWRGRLIGCLFAVIRTARVLSERVRIAKLEEMRTAPEVRGRGVMSALFESVRAGARERGARVLQAGPASPYSLPIFQKRLHFATPFYVRTLVRPLRLVPRLSPGRSQPRSNATTDWDALWPLTRPPPTPPDVAAALERSETYLRWRYASHPDEYFVSSLPGGPEAGNIVWKLTRQRGLFLCNVVDVVAPTSADWIAGLRRSLRSINVERLADMLVLWEPRRGAVRRAFAAGFLPRLARVPFLLRCEPDVDTTTAGALLSRSWFVTMGDYLDI